VNQPLCMVVTQDRPEDEAADAGSDSDDERRHAAMLADVRAAGDGNRKRKRRDVLMSEAYPESEYNLNPASGGEAAWPRRCPCEPSHCAVLQSTGATGIACALAPSANGRHDDQQPLQLEHYDGARQVARLASCSCRT
jgi:hypothetical protein